MVRHPLPRRFCATSLHGPDGNKCNRSTICYSTTLIVIFLVDLPAHPTHISNHDLERFHLGLAKDEAELATLDQHLRVCSDCTDAAEEAAQYVDTVRAAIIV